MNVSADGTELWRKGVEHDVLATRSYGFWLFMMSDALIFAALFAVYGVMDHQMATFGGPNAHAITKPLDGLFETFAVFASVLSLSLGMVAFKYGSRLGVTLGIMFAFLFGAVFLGFEIHEFGQLASKGYTPELSGFLSSYYALVATHGLHIAVGMFWMSFLVFQLWTQGITDGLVGRMLNLRMYWQFQGTIWICIYAFVTLRGAF
ncbi:MAG: hypothetical protein B7Z80_25360 [Rhodospirillales bacterium 20-64-7]|jgi:cytochrome o ubiquinol oxidase subunit 3|nr:MAG: hypothetical protein B7Z80_25360 [Rhodospirillales bacterium 20-64-7]